MAKKKTDNEEILANFELKQEPLSEQLDKNTHNQLVVTAREKQLQVIDKMRANLPREFKKRSKELAKQIDSYNIAIEDGNAIDSHEKLLSLCEYAFKPIINTNGTMMTYNENEIAVGFDYYRKIVLQLNKNGNFYMPTREDFCRLMGISSTTFLSYAHSNSAEMQEICTMITDYMASAYVQAGLTRKIDTITGMFYQKSALGRKETSVEQAPQQVTNNIVISDSELREMMKKIM